jgi:hypothetical protein
MYSGISLVPKMSSGSRSRLKSKKDESQDCNQNQEKGMRREDYSRMVRFFDGKLFSSSGFFPLVRHGLGGFSGSGGREGVKWWKCVRIDLQSTREAILLAVEVHWEWWMAGVYWWEYQTTGVFLGREGFSHRNSVHGSRMRIFCGFYAKEQEFVRIQLEERFPNAFKTVKICMHKLKKSSQDEYKR